MKTKKTSALMIATVLFGTILTISCSKTEVATLPAIGGYNCSNDVAAANLLAHWTFDGTNNERISGTAPLKATNAAFTSTTASTQRQALQLTSGYLVFPSIPALNTANAIPNVTVSTWVNVNNNAKTVSSVFALTQAQATQTDWNQGPINMYIETGKPLTVNDTLVFHSAFHTYSGGNYNLGGDNINDYGMRGTDFQTVKGANKWVHYVMVYDGAGSNIDIYANGIRVSNNNFRNRTTGTPPAGIGSIIMAPPTQVVMGSMPNSDAGYTKSAAQTWQGLFTGSIDEVRVYSKALSATDIGYLYQLELAGR